MYLARTDDLPETVASGGLVDPRAKEQALWPARTSYRDLTEFISNTILVSPLVRNGVASEKRLQFNRILSRSKEIQVPRADHNAPQPLSDLVPGLVVTGGRSRSPAFDCLPRVSHWADRTGETSAEDPATTVRLTSTWGTTYVVGEGTNKECPLGAPCWSLKTHCIDPVEVGSGKFSQQYLAETDTLITTVHLAHRADTAQTGGVLNAAANVAWGRNARVADAVDCAVGMLADAAVLLGARNKVISSGKPQCLSFATVFPATMPTWCAARKPLPPKLSGVALSPDQITTDVISAEECAGGLINTSIFSMSVGYNRGMYGGSITGLWAIMDSSFILDYSIGKNSAMMAEKLANAFADVAASAEASVSAGPHITDVRVVKGCDYACLRQKTIIEDTYMVVSSPCFVVWDDLLRLARYKLADAVFCHTYYDAGGGEQMAAIAGLGCFLHDWIDLGADLACGEVSNIIPTLTRGSLDEAPLVEVYSRLLGAMIWYRDNDTYNPAATAILFTHWWQLANCRHRPITLLGRTDLNVSVMAIAATIPSEHPPLEHFRAHGTAVERGERPFAAAEARFQALLASNMLPETRRVAELLVRPVLAFVRGTDDHLPLETEYVGAVLAAEIAYPQGQKVCELWDLAIVMWECGAMWGSGCYTHTGNSNCDRARSDLSDATWH
ncbi:hypothetical protein B0H14DRAFT_3480208 [Mycena olivaceomarginata]|nr:hypothetical protein B0H14DRAFT_3480208 [Mycena olivaceomarginata]